MQRLSSCKVCHPMYVPLRSTELYVEPVSSTYSLMYVCVPLLSIGYRELFAPDQRGQAMNLTAHLCVQPRKSMRGAYAPVPITCLYGIRIHRDNLTKPDLRCLSIV